MKTSPPFFGPTFGLFLLGLFPAFGEVPSNPESPDAEPLNLAHEWADGVGGNRPEALEAVLDETYEHIHGTGLVESRSQFLAALRNGTRRYQPLSLEDLKIRILGDIALVTGKFALKVEVRGKFLEGVNRFCMTMVKRPAGWKMVQFQATAVNLPKANPDEELKKP